MEQLIDIAESAVVGAIILDAEACADIFPRLSPDMFYNETMKELYKAAYRLQARGETVDAVTIQGEAGAQYQQSIILCAETAPSIANASAYAAVVRNRWRVRTMQTEMGELLADADWDADQLTARLEKIVDMQRLIASSEEGGSVRAFDTCMDDFLQELETPDDALQSGWGCFDRLGFFERGNAVVLAGRPGCGKTDLAVNIAARAALHHRVLYLSLEVPRKQIIRRIVSRITKISGVRLQQNKCTPDEIESAKKAVSLLGEQTKLFLDDTPALSLEDVTARVFQYQPELLVVDHIGLMAGKHNQKEWERLSEITAGLKALAKRHNLVVMELVQLNRNVDRQRGAPVLADLRGSGTIEQDADVVVMLAPDVQDECEEERRVEAFVRKNRSGPLATVDLLWIPKWSRYTEIVDYEPPEVQKELCPFEQTKIK